MPRQSRSTFEGSFAEFERRRCHISRCRVVLLHASPKTDLQVFKTNSLSQSSNEASPSEHDMLLGLLASLLESGSNTSRFLGQIWFIRRALQAPEDTGWASAEPRATPKTSQRKTVMASSHKLSEPHQENLMQLHDTVACLTRSGLLANSIRYQSASSSDDLETDLGTWGPHQNSQSLPLFLLGPCLG